MRLTFTSLALAAALALPGAASADGFDLKKMTPEQREAFGAQVRNYLLENPEVIMDAVAVLERRQAAEQVANDAALIATNFDAIYNDPMSHVGGNPDGELTKLVDKRVGIIGTGATAVQCVPHLGAGAEQLYVFQRTPSSIDVRNNHPIDPGWFADLEPGWQRRWLENFTILQTGRIILKKPTDIRCDQGDGVPSVLRCRASCRVTASIRSVADSSISSTNRLITFEK